MKFKFLSSILISLLVSEFAFSQTLSLDIVTGIQVNDLKFNTSSGEEIDYSRGVTSIVGIGSSIKFDSGLSLSVSLDNYSVKSMYIDNSVQTRLELDYIRPSLNLSYSFGENALRPVIGSGLGYGILVQGVQSNDGNLYNLKSTGSIGNDLHIMGLIGVQGVTKSGPSIGLYYQLQQSLTNNEESIGQETKIFIHGILAKVGFTL